MGKQIASLLYKLTGPQLTRGQFLQYDEKVKKKGFSFSLCLGAHCSFFDAYKAFSSHLVLNRSI